MPTQIIHATGLTGLFRVVAMGQLSLGAPFDPKIKLLFRRIQGFEGTAIGQGRAIYGSEMTSLSVPIGEMLSLGVGTTVDSDRVIEAPDIVEHTVTVDFRHGLDGCVRRRALVQRGLLKPLEECSAVNEVRPEDSWWYSAPCLDPRFKTALFPASLLYTTYYAPTSRLATRILAGDLNDLAATFVDAGKSRPLNANRHAEIHLRRGVLRAEGLPISRAWYQPAFHERMCSIHGSVAVSAISGEAAGLCVAPPPTAQIVSLRVKALVWRPSPDARPSLVVLAILDSDEALPFRTLDVHLDQSEPGDGNEGDPGNLGRGRPPAQDFLSLFCKLDGNETRPGESPPKVVVIETPSVCFSALAELRVSRRKRKQTKRKRKPGETNASTNTTRSWAGRRGDPDNQHTDLAQSGGNRSEQGDEAEETKTPMEALDGLLQAVRCLREDFGVGLVARIVTAKAMGYREFEMNELQKPEEARSSSWYYLAGTQLARPVLLLELQLDQRRGLLLEIVRNAGEQFSSLFVSKPDGAAFSDAELRSLLALVEVAQQVPRNIEISAAVGGSRDVPADIRRFRHGTDPQALAERIVERLREDLPDPP